MQNEGRCGDERRRQAAPNNRKNKQTWAAKRTACAHTSTQGAKGTIWKIRIYIHYSISQSDTPKTATATTWMVWICACQIVTQWNKEDKKKQQQKKQARLVQRSACCEKDCGQGQTNRINSSSGEWYTVAPAHHGHSWGDSVPLWVTRTLHIYITTLTLWRVTFRPNITPSQQRRKTLIALHSGKILAEYCRFVCVRSFSVACT